MINTYAIYSYINYLSKHIYYVCKHYCASKQWLELCGSNQENNSFQLWFSYYCELLLHGLIRSHIYIYIHRLDQNDAWLCATMRTDTNTSLPTRKARLALITFYDRTHDHLFSCPQHGVCVCAYETVPSFIWFFLCACQFPVNFFIPKSSKFNLKRVFRQRTFTNIYLSPTLRKKYIYSKVLKFVLHE